jgi:DNA (cytosine-5)-methyltransferase 1
VKQLTVGSLFSGIGGIDLGLERAGMRVVWQSEIDPYASRVLAKHWPGVPNHGDITRIDFTAVEPVDVVAGGFPCQGIANPGKKYGLNDRRSGLWREFVRAIRTLRPRYVLVENSGALVVRGLPTILGDLAALGYDAEWSVVSACSLGAPHTRERLFLVAYTNTNRYHGTWLPSEPRQGLPRTPWGDLGRGGISAPASHDAADQPRLLRVADGVPDRMDRIAGLGNAVVPQIPELIGGWIVEHWNATQTEAAA